MKIFNSLLLATCLLVSTFLFSQDTINLQMPTSINLDGSPPDGSAMLDVQSTTKGMLVPRMTTSQRTAMPLPANGLLVFDTDTGSFWYFTNSDWFNLSEQQLLVDVDGDTKIQVEESPDEDFIRFDVRGNQAMVIDTVGNVGIGTNTPFARLDVRGSGTDNAALMFLGNSDLSHRLLLFPGRENDPNPFIQWKDGDPLRFATDQGGFSEKMRIDTAGNVGIGTSTPDASALLELSSNSKGMLVPRMTTAQRTAIPSPATGLLVFDTDTGGFWFFNGAAWSDLSSPHQLADADADTKIQLEQSPDEDIIRFDLGGTENMVLLKNASGIPRLELNNAQGNNFIGEGSGNSNTTGTLNTALGSGALGSNTVNSNLVAVGDSALYNNQGGFSGLGQRNTAVGSRALFSNTLGGWNTAVGFRALANHLGVFTSGGGGMSFYYDNTAIGESSMFSSLYGGGNTAIGKSSLNSFTQFNNCTAIGSDSDISAVNQINATALGYAATANASNKVRIGNASVTVIEGQVDWTFPSDARFKFNIQDEDVPGLAFINELRPVTYQFDTQKFEEHLMQNMQDSIQEKRMEDTDYAESTARLQTGFLAQEVEQICEKLNYEFSGLHVPTSEVDNYGLSYGSFVPLLVKAVQELADRTGGQQVLIENLQAENTALQSQLAEMDELKSRMAMLETALLQLTSSQDEASED